LLLKNNSLFVSWTAGFILKTFLPLVNFIIHSFIQERKKGEERTKQESQEEEEIKDY